jgi:hypothetical protein
MAPSSDWIRNNAPKLQQPPLSLAHYKREWRAGFSWIGWFADASWQKSDLPDSFLASKNVKGGVTWYGTISVPARPYLRILIFQYSSNQVEGARTIRNSSYFPLSPIWLCTVRDTGWYRRSCSTLQTVEPKSYMWLFFLISRQNRSDCGSLTRLPEINQSLRKGS